ncbi:MAG: Uma2 family endonuclease [Planctomycetaceae bacterium]|nr:Uma2 family endonuclease [Planctomycetaceae bacterium]
MSTVTETQKPTTQPQELPAEPRSRRGTPTWEMARFHPYQGEWTEEQYLSLETNHLVEYNNGMLEFQSMPTKTHQRLVMFLSFLLNEFVKCHEAGEVLIAPFRIRTSDGKFREPDILYLAPSRPQSNRFAEGADLVIEVVSEGEDSRDRDLVEKRIEYAASGIPEYWIVDPETKTISVLTLDNDAYKSHGEFKPGESATSVLLEGFTVDVKSCFDAAFVEEGTAEDTEQTKG